MRGLSVALIEAKDFAAATSAHNSKLAHGGLRYLRGLEFSLVRESLRERRTLLAIAPHLVRPLPFLLPLYGAGFSGRATLAAGLTLYDLLAFDRQRLEDPAQRLPRHRWIGGKTALAREPVLAGQGFEGAFEYHDAQMYSPERIALECLIDADAHGAAIANHCRGHRVPEAPRAHRRLHGGRCPDRRPLRHPGPHRPAGGGALGRPVPGTGDGPGGRHTNWSAPRESICCCRR